mmetsp:Transcript_43515/g.79205  ORF Transcript_43515/g.79205 Transcript_43515/m.79205 type:complete len:356 (+) Transcript_43515:106-1173(+)
MRRHSQWLALCGTIAIALSASSPRFHGRGFILSQPSPPRQTSAGQLRQLEQRNELQAGIGASGASSEVFAVGSTVVLLSLAFGATARTSRRGTRIVQVVARRAEGEDDDFFGKVQGEAEEKQADEEEAEQKAAEEQLEAGDESADDEAEKEKEIQEKIEVYPSKQYVNYIARNNAYRYWRGEGKLQVDIALLTERIRNLVLTCQEHPHDYLARDTLVKLVARRRRFLDRLSWEDLDSYLKMREELKIRHNFRVEALIGRAKEYKYTVENRPTAPGRKTTMRLKKTRRLLENRLARQLKQGRPRKIVSTTRKRLFGRRYAKMANDEAKDYVGRRDPNLNSLMDPIDMYEKKKWSTK